MSESTVSNTPNSWMDDVNEQLGYYRRDLLRYCQQLKLPRSDAEDITQTALLKALPILQSNQTHPNPSALLRRIAKNAWIDHLRKQAKWTLGGDIQLPMMQQEMSMDQGLMVEDAFQTLIHRLTPNQRIIFLMCDTFQYTVGEVAQLMKLSQGAVKALLHRARSRLTKDTSADTWDSSGVANESQRELLHAYSAAFYSADVLALLQLCQSGSMDVNYATRKVISLAEHHLETKRQSIVVENCRSAA